ncbi:hypothetical protein HAZT_HAZT006475 [Hyalella azteca]|uniref:39S ribosomal protein L1, mitochondrial n=1 Tax=Hyalella azteca TaxID=294128 RepID=A0A6A0H958_HYAAZ|nr:hypothetical protein HAZT_HAZT006475 [Hyalella azteca]
MLSFSTTTSGCFNSIYLNICRSFHLNALNAAARKGTRARREAIKKANKKKKIEQEVKTGWIPFSERKKLNAASTEPPNYTWRNWPPADDVYVARYFRWPEHSVSEAVTKLREIHQPTIYNYPDAPVFLTMDVSLATDKAKRFLTDVSGVVLLPHAYDAGQSRSVAVLTDDHETRTKAQEMGVQLVCGKEIVKLVLGGEVDLLAYDYIVSSLDILPELVPIRGILKKKFPNPSNGTSVVNVADTAFRFLTGVQYECAVDTVLKAYGSITVAFGALSMEDEHLTANAQALLTDIESHRIGRKSADLITRVYVKCNTTSERLVLDHKAYIPKDLGYAPAKKTKQQETTEEPQQEAVAN